MLTWKIKKTKREEGGASIVFFLLFFFGGEKVESRLEKKGEVRKAVSHQGGRVEQSRLHTGSRLRRRRRGEKVKSDHITPLPSNQ